MQRADQLTQSASLDARKIIVNEDSLWEGTIVQCTK